MNGVADGEPVQGPGEPIGTHQPVGHGQPAPSAATEARAPRRPAARSGYPTAVQLALFDLADPSP